MKPTLTLRTLHHPQANGRTQSVGEPEHILKFQLEDGRELILKTGTQDLEQVREQIDAQLARC